MTISSTFNTSIDGWTIQGGGSGPAYVSDGAGGGFIRSSDTAADSFFFSAPNKFLGNKIGFFGGTLSFQVRRSDGAEWDEPQDVILTNGAGKTIYVVLPARPDVATFTSYSYALDTTGGWKLASGAAASTADIQEVLSDLAKMLIIGDLVSGNEASDLDNVVMQGGAAVHRFEFDPSGADPGDVFGHASLADALAAAAPGQWVVVNDAESRADCTPLPSMICMWQRQRGLLRRSSSVPA